MRDTIAACVPTTYPDEDRQAQPPDDLSSAYPARRQRITASTIRANSHTN
jgi:hypothetical protein